MTLLLSCLTAWFLNAVVDYTAWFLSSCGNEYCGPVKSYALFPGDQSGRGLSSDSPIAQDASARNQNNLPHSRDNHCPDTTPNGSWGLGGHTGKLFLLNLVASIAMSTRHATALHSQKKHKITASGCALVSREVGWQPKVWLVRVS